MQGREHRDDLADRHVWEQRPGLEHRSDESLRDHLLGRVTEDAGRSLVGSSQSEQHVDGGRLAGAVGPEQGDHLTRRDVEVDPSDRLDGSVPLDQSVESDRHAGVGTV